jgi:hypothetical protein
MNILKVLHVHVLNVNLSQIIDNVQLQIAHHLKMDVAQIQTLVLLMMMKNLDVYLNVHKDIAKMVIHA